MHGGTIKAESAGEGQGATFTMLLPVRAIASRLGEAEDAAVAVTGSEELPILAGMKVLVVDDQADARELVEFVLAQYGAEVIGASSASEAYEPITASRNGNGST